MIHPHLGYDSQYVHTNARMHGSLRSTLSNNTLAKKKGEKSDPRKRHRSGSFTTVYVLKLSRRAPTKNNTSTLLT